MAQKDNRTAILLLLTLVYGFNFIDRQIVGILAPFIQGDLELTDTQLGLMLGPAFAVFYTVMGIPLALLADRVNRVKLLSWALAFWSAFTALTGFTNNFLQIGLARIGVGVGEAGGSPPSHSMISDLYSKEERAGALGIYALGIPLGIMSAYFVTAILLGTDPSTVNWRKIFFALGISGVLLAVVVRFAIREPERGAMELKSKKALPKTSLKIAIPQLLKIPSWWYMCLGITFASFASYSFSGFQTKFLRVLDPEYNFRTIVIWLGIINGLAYTSGTFFGAKLVDKWGKRNIRAYGWAPLISLVIAMPIAIASFWVDSINAHLALTVGLLLCLGVYLGPSFAIAQTLAPTQIRATSTALFFFVLNMIALGGGPFLTGWLMDLIAHNPDNLPKKEFETTVEYFEAVRMAMTYICFSFILAIFFFFMVTRTLPKDWAEAERRNEVDLQG